MLTVNCSGTPYEIGYQHGQAAESQIGGSIAFYEGLFIENSKKSWPQVRDLAKAFDGEIKQQWPAYHEEMKGIADGSNRDILDIIAINVRTEIAFGLFSDGCTSIYWKTEKRALLGQNWDWMEAQKPNLILVTIQQASKPTIKMVTEAGLIGKIGMNSLGVGVCFNAIKAPGLDTSRIPAHLALRLVLESSSAKEAVEALERKGVASSSHMLIADASGAVGLEVTSTTTLRCAYGGDRVIHSNHLLEKHPGADDSGWLPDSLVRHGRMHALAGEFDAKRKEPTFAEFSRLFEDTTNSPTAICRSQEAPSTSATLFNIVMDLKEKRAVVRLGKPTQPEETVDFTFE